MSGLISAGGLITGIDTNSLIKQLMQLERQPILRMQRRIVALEQQRDAIKDLRTQLQSLRSKVQDFRFGIDFNQFKIDTSDSAVATAAASGANPTSGSFSINVTRLASATIATSSGAVGASINPAAAFASSGVNHEVTSGTFSINGTEFNFDFTVSSLNDVLGAINGAGIGVLATYDGASDTVTLTNTALGDTSIINFGASSDTSNFLELINVEKATQFTNGGGTTEVISSVGIGAINQGKLLNQQSYAAGVIGGGNFFINGVAITVDPAVDALSDVIERINNSDAGVTASYDPTTDGIRVVSENLGSRTISFVNGTSNFLDVLKLTGSVQTAGQDSEFSIDGGAVQTRNSNDITDAIGDMTIKLKSLGTTTITVAQDQDAAIELIREFVETFNESIKEIAELVGKEGKLSGDGSIRGLKTFLQTTVFNLVTGLPGNFESLLSIGISTGEGFDVSAVFSLEIDETELRAAIEENFSNIEQLFANDAETGIADQLFAFLEDVTKTRGFLNDRSRSNGSIDDQIKSLNERIDAKEDRVAVKEARLRAQFVRMEQLAAHFQTQAASFAGFGVGFGF